MTRFGPRCALATAAALVIAVAGCGGEERLRAEDLPRLVLQQEDVGSLRMFDEGPQTRADMPEGERSDPRRFGRVDGWKARYRRTGSADTAGPLVVESRADLFADADGAERELAAARRELAATFEPMDGGEIGEESWAATMLQPTATADARYFTIVWRDANVVASIFVQGFDQKMPFGDALSLAREQQERIEAAKES